MRFLRALPLLATAALLAPPSAARARTFAIEYTGRAVADPAAGFDVACWPDPEPNGCAVRAAALEAELVDQLAELEGETDAATIAVFESMATMPSPRLQQISLAYLGSHTAPATFWDKARAFFFGSDAEVGQPAAEFLAGSADATDRQLAQSYLQGRPSVGYGGSQPVGAGFDDSWAIGAARDSLLDQVSPFQESELFPGASRLLMIDRFVTDSYVTPAPEVPVTGFVTASAVADVRTHFASVFGGSPFPSVSESQARYTAISQEMATLAPLLLQGDPAAMARYQALAAEAQEVSKAMGWGTRLGLFAAGATDHEFWVDAPRDAYASGAFPRAVAVGTDAVMGQTVIRHFGGALGTGGTGGGGTGGGGSGGGGTGGGGTNPGTSPAAEGKSGCGSSASPAPWALLLLAGWIGLRRGRARPAV